MRKSVESSTFRTFGWDGLIQILLIGNSIVMLAPIVIMVFSAFKTNAQISSRRSQFQTSPMCKAFCGSGTRRIFCSTWAIR